MISEIADLERDVGDYLRDNGIRAVALPPEEDKRASAWVQITLLSVRDGGDPDRIVEGMLQLNCYASGPTRENPNGGGQPEATGLARQVRALLKDMQGTTQGDAVFGAVRIIGHLRAPDIGIEPARERVILTVTLVHHVA